MSRVKMTVAASDVEPGDKLLHPDAGELPITGKKIREDGLITISYLKTGRQPEHFFTTDDYSYEVER